MFFIGIEKEACTAPVSGGGRGTFFGDDASRAGSKKGAGSRRRESQCQRSGAAESHGRVKVSLLLEIVNGR